VVLEVACNKGVNLIELAKKYPKTIFVGIDVDKEAIQEANEELAKYQYQNIKFLKADAFRMKFPDNTFDYIINEAMLTMFSNKSKERALKEYLRVLKPGGLLLTHDIALVNNYEETRKQLSEAINISVFPLPQNEWKELFSQIGFTTVNFLQDELTLMDPKGMITDEGLTNTLRILKNGLKSHLLQFILACIAVIYGFVMLFNPIVAGNTIAKILSFFVIMNGISYILSSIIDVEIE